MTLDSYQEFAERYMKLDSGGFDLSDRAIMSYAIGLGEETGEVLGVVNKQFFAQGLPDIKDELGDVLWYISALATAYGWSLETIAEGNLRKLNKRFPDGWRNDGGVR